MESATSRKGAVTARGAGFPGMSPAGRLGLMLALAGGIVLGLGVALWSRQPAEATLYSGLAAEEVSSAAAQLAQRGIPYRVDPDGGAVLVPSQRLPEARFLLAPGGASHAAGAGSPPATGETPEPAARALEQRIADSLTAMAAVESARVHLARPGSALSSQRAGASVLLTLAPGRGPTAEQVEGIARLVASGIPRLEPAGVTVIDQEGNLLRDGRDEASAVPPPKAAASPEETFGAPALFAGAGLLTLMLLFALVRTAARRSPSAAGGEPPAGQGEGAGKPLHEADTARPPATEKELERLRSLAMEDPKRLARVVKTWLSDDHQ